MYIGKIVPPSGNVLCWTGTAL